MKCPECDREMFTTFFFDTLFWACLWCRVAIPIQKLNNDIQGVISRYEKDI